MKRNHNPKRCMPLLVIFLLFALQAGAQVNEGLGRLFSENEKNDTLIVFADTAYIRDKPGTTGQKIGLVTVGTKVVFVENSDVQKISGFEAPWTKVRFINNNNWQEGFIWKGLVALGKGKRGGKLFLYGIDHAIPDKMKDMPATGFAKVKVVDSVNTLLAVASWQLSSSDATSFSEEKVLGNMGMEGITDIVRVHFSGEACGIPDDYYYFGWTGTEFLTLPGKTQVADAGAFYHGEELIFPSEKGGQPGKIIRLIEDEEVLDEMDAKTKEPKVKKSKSREMYSWDGKKAVKL